ncbi:MAG: hypothetical protein JXM79_15485 [Sedimentisphaerales bacterium]|nr:hypothetical protein [Sedimentisphaerales bacterium]
MRSKIVTGKDKHVRGTRYFILTLFVAGFVSSSAYALDPMGPPACVLQKGEYRNGLEVTFGSWDLETSTGKGTRYVNGVYDVGSNTVNLGTLKNFETYRGYVTVGYSPYRTWEIFGRLGGVTGTLDDEFWSEGEKFESHRELALGGGIRKTFYEEFALTIGGLAQANWTKFDGPLETSDKTGFLDIDMLEIQAALGATYMFSDRIAVYGGPFITMIYGDIECVYSYENGSDFVTLLFDWDIEDDINYGAYVGTRIMLKQDCSINIEYQQTSDAYVIGAGLMLRR